MFLSRSHIRLCHGSSFVPREASDMKESRSHPEKPRGKRKIENPCARVDAVLTDPTTRLSYFWKLYVVFGQV